MSLSVEKFKNNIKSVSELINFDREFMTLAIDNIEELHKTLSNHPYDIKKEQHNGKRALDILKPIRSNDALKTKFRTINNQAIVLLVSYFGSAVAEIFRGASQIAVDIHNDPRVINTELKVKIEELVEFDIQQENAIGDILIIKNNISFQDMKSIQREFKKYFGINILKDNNVNNIILGQACRHSIAHEAGIVNSRTINQINGAIPRVLKLKLNEEIKFSEQEINILSASMLNYIEKLADQVKAYSQETI